MLKPGSVDTFDGNLFFPSLPQNIIHGLHCLKMYTEKGIFLDTERSLWKPLEVFKAGLGGDLSNLV